MNARDVMERVHSFLTVNFLNEEIAEKNLGTLAAITRFTLASETGSTAARRR